MDLELTIGQLAAVLRLAYIMAEADGRVDYEEEFEVKLEEAFLGLEKEEAANVEIMASELSSLAACAMVSEIEDPETRSYVTAFLAEVMIADGEISEKEIAVWQTISEICNLPEMSIEEAMDIMEGDDEEDDEDDE